MQIRPTNNINTTHAVNLQTRVTTEKATQSLPVDQLDISAAARSIEAQTIGGARADRIADIRTQIAQGKYETAEKMDLALSRMFDEIA